MASATGALAASGRVARRVALGGDDLKSLLGAPILARSQHFVLHARLAETSLQQLPTEIAPIRTRTVDKALDFRLPGLALVVPKRHAKRAVTRNLIKRQMRAQADLHHEHLPPGQWVLRLRAPFDPGRYPSAASMELQIAARAELALVFANAGAA